MLHPQIPKLRKVLDAFLVLRLRRLSLSWGGFCFTWRLGRLRLLLAGLGWQGFGCHFGFRAKALLYPLAWSWLHVVFGQAEVVACWPGVARFWIPLWFLDYSAVIFLGVGLASFGIWLSLAGLGWQKVSDAIFCFRISAFVSALGWAWLHLAFGQAEVVAFRLRMARFCVLFSF